METQIQENRLVSDLSERRLVQYVGAYIALAFGIIQFAMLAEQRYDWSASLVDKLVLFFVLLLPAVIVFTYNHGKPGIDAWKPFEKVFIPANIVIALLGSLLSFNNAAPKTETVTLIDESGVEEQHIVPSKEYSNNITVLPFNRAEDVELWEAQVLSYLTYLDMEQDSRLAVNSLFQLKEDLLSYDLDYTKEMTQSKAVKIARDNLSDYYITADINRIDGLVEFTPVVFNTNSGKEYFTNTYTGESIYDLVDGFTAEFNQKIYPEEDSHFSFTDSPANEIISPNDDVVKIYVQNLYSLILNPQISSTVLESMNKAVELDEGCALCYEQLATGQATLNIDGYVETYSQALKHSDALPEKLKYRIRYNSYLTKSNFEKAVKVAERWSTLFPYDIEPYSNLINYNLNGFRVDEAKSIYKKAIEKGHKSLLRGLANLQITSEEYDDAMLSINEYKKLFPHKAAELLQVGDMFVKQGKLPEAIEFFEDILISDPSNVSASLKTANAYGRIGDYTDEINILNDALEFAKTPLDSVRILDGFKANYLRLGKEEKFMNLVKMQNELNQSNYPPMLSIMLDISANIMNYKNFNNAEHVEGLYNQAIGMADTAQKDMLACARDFNVGNITKDKERLQKSFDECGDMLKASLGEGGEHFISASLAGANRNYDAAIESYKKFAEESGGKLNIIWPLVIDHYFDAQRYDEGIALIEEVFISNPESPAAQYYKAKFGIALNQIDESKKYLTKALDSWEGASPNYRYYQEATALAKEISL